MCRTFAHRVAMAAGAPLTFVLLVACHDEALLTNPSTVDVLMESLHEAALEDVKALPTLSLHGDPPFLAVAAAIPSFSGFYFDDQGRLVVAATDGNEIARALPLIRPYLSAHRATSDYVVEIVEYPFVELAQYRTALRRYVFAIPGVATLGVKESRNRVQVGVSSNSAEKQVRELVSALGIPSDAVIYHYMPEALELSHELDEGAGIIQGGWQIATLGHGCSLGFSALTASGNEVFVTNSHCTTVVHSYDGELFFQPVLDSGYYIGQELLDPEPHTCQQIC